METVMNVVTFYCDYKQAREILEEIKNDKYGYGSIDLNKLEPMPQELLIETGNRTYEALRQYKKFISEYSSEITRSKEELLNVPKEKEDLYLGKREDIRREDWELGRQAYQNELKYGAPTWERWADEHWGTLCSVYRDCWQIDGNKISFETSWSSPMGLIRKISEKYPGIEIGVKWASESSEYDAGEYVCSDGEIISDYSIEDERERSEFSDKVWAEGYKPQRNNIDLTQ